MGVLVAICLFAAGGGLIALPRTPKAQASVSGGRVALPLTDVAPVPRTVEVRREEAPEYRQFNVGSPSTALAGTPALMSDIAAPPQWTPRLAMPGTPAPPNPFVAPPVKVNPARGN